jgi:hypothetical protein
MRVPDEAREALTLAGMQPLRWELASTFAPASTRRPSYRVELRGGGAIKVRCLLDASSAEDNVRVRAAMAAPALSPVILRHGRVLVEPWVDGTPLAGGPLPDAHVEAAAAVLAGIHATEEIAGRRVRGETTTRAWLDTTAGWLEYLVARGALTAAAAETLRETQRRTDPGTTSSGVIHGDFCAENMVVDRSGRLVVIDNEDCRVDALDYDLGLVWYRSGAEDASFARFAGAYARTSGRTLPPSRFWMIAALTKGARYRVELFPDGAAPVVARLERLAAELVG